MSMSGLKKSNTEIKTDPTAYVINSDALGDIIACLAPLKYAVDTYHESGQYLVYILMEFKDLFFFVPKDKLRSIETDPLESYYVQNFLNLHVSGQRIHPLRIKLSDYASLNLMTRILPLDKLNYLKIPLGGVDLSKKFQLDFTKSVVISPLYKDDNRRLANSEIIKICDYLVEQGITPVLLGKASEKYKNFELPKTCLNLINRTTLPEAAKIMSLCKAVVGVDCGLIHLAGMTDAPIISGYTYASPEIRMPIRNNKIGYNVTKIVPNIPCAFCQDRWQLESYAFAVCYLGTNECVKKLTAKKFIKALEKFIWK